MKKEKDLSQLIEKTISEFRLWKVTVLDFDADNLFDKEWKVKYKGKTYQEVLEDKLRQLLLKIANAK